jgi:predicted transcriptional regulator
MLRLNMTKVLQKARSKDATSVADIAEQTGISKATLHRLANGDKEPSLTTVWKLRSVYGGRIETYVYEDPHATRPARLPRPRKAPAESPRET